MRRAAGDDMIVYFTLERLFQLGQVRFQFSLVIQRLGAEKQCDPARDGGRHIALVVGQALASDRPPPKFHVAILPSAPSAVLKARLASIVAFERSTRQRPDLTWTTKFENFWAARLATFAAFERRMRQRPDRRSASKIRNS